MNCLPIFISTAALLVSATLSKKYPIQPSDVGLSAPEMIRNHGYPVEIHHITTEDGYILEYHRIPHGFNDTAPKKRPPVINFHGLHFTSAQDLCQGPGKGLHFILADAGYDVWAANSRGNHYSDKHQTLDKDKDSEKFYDFSHHEMGYYDVPAAVDYILNVTGQDGVFYTGNSVGATVFLIFAASRPEYNKKIKMAALFSAAPYISPRNQTDIESGVALNTYAMMKYLEDIWTFAKRQKLVMIQYKYLRQVGPYLCQQFMDTCVDYLSYLCESREDAEAFRPYIPTLLTNAPTEVSIKTYAHVGQQLRDGNFNWFNYGRKKNLEVYGTEQPPEYNVSLITAPVATFYAAKDFLVSRKDQERLKKALPNLVYDFLETSGRYNHMSFGAAKDVAEVVWKDVVRLMNKYR